MLSYPTKGDFVDVINLRTLTWEDYQGLSGWTQWTQRGSDKGKRDRGVRDREGDVITEAEKVKEMYNKEQVGVM